MENKQLEIIKTVAMMFKAAPGAHYLSEFDAWINTTGGSVKDLAVSLAQTDVFKQALYADTLSNHEFSMQFIENSVDSLVNDENKAWAVSEIEHMLDAGVSRGEVIYWAATALASVDQNDVNWGAAARQFSNQVAVATFYSIDQTGPATSLDVLQRVTANVTPDIVSVAATQASLASGAAGKVIDGYVKGAHVFADLNGDGLLNPGEVSAITDALGGFSLPGITGFGNLIASGGIDAATGKPFEGSMTAPAGATVINPLTTLIDGITENSAISVQDATVKILASLGLNAGIDLLHFDPIKETIRTDIDATATSIALAIHVAAVQIQILISQTAAVLSGTGVAPDETTAIDLAYETIAASLAGTTGSDDLTSKDAIAYVIQDAAARSGADSAAVLKVGVLLADAAQTIANLNRAVTDKSTRSTNESKILSSIAAVQIVAENIEAAMKSGAAKGSVSGTVISTTGSLFANTITAAGSKVGDVTGDGKPDPLPVPPSSGGGSAPPLPTDKYFLATNATAFSGTAGDDILSISTAATWTPLVMTAVVLDGGSGTNTLSLQDGSSIAAAIVTNFPNLSFDATGIVGTNNVTMSATQNQNFTGTITAPGTGVNGETITVTGDGTVTTLTNIENYELEDDSTNARTVTITDTTTNVTATSATDAVTFALGVLNFTGTISGDATVADTLNLSNGADISGGTVTNVTALSLASGASVRLSAAQNQSFSGAVTAPGTGVNGETITVTGDGTVTTLTNIENYELEDDSTNARTVTITDTTTNVTATSATDAVTFALGVLNFTGTISGDATVADTLNLSNGADISGGTVTNVTALSLASGASVRLSAAQNQGFSGAVTATGTGVNGEKITIIGNGTVTALSNIEIYELSDDTTNARTVTTGSTALNLIADNASDTVTVNAAALAQNAALTVAAASASAMVINNLVGDVIASNLSGSLAVTTANAVDNGIAITTGSAVTSVNVAAGAASDTVTIDATALTNNTALTVTAAGGAAGIVNVIGLTGNLAVSNPTSGTIGIAVADNTVDDGIAITAGAASLAITSVADGDTVTVTGFTGSTLTGAIAGSTGKFNITAGTATSNITTGAGDDSFTFVSGTGLTSADTVNGSTGTDTIALTGNTAVAATIDSASK